LWGDEMYSLANLWRVQNFSNVCPSENQELHFTRLDHYEKMSKIIVTLWIHFSRQDGYILEKKNRLFGIV